MVTQSLCHIKKKSNNVNKSTEIVQKVNELKSIFISLYFHLHLSRLNVNINKGKQASVWFEQSWEASSCGRLTDEACVCVCALSIPVQSAHFGLFFFGGSTGQVTDSHCRVHYYYFLHCFFVRFLYGGILIMTEFIVFKPFGSHSPTNACRDFSLTVLAVAEVFFFFWRPVTQCAITFIQKGVGGSTQHVSFLFVEVSKISQRKLYIAHNLKMNGLVLIVNSNVSNKQQTNTAINSAGASLYLITDIQLFLLSHK